MSRRQDLEVFAAAPVGRAVLAQIAPAVASQMITLIYNLADTYFVGLLNDPGQTAAVTVAYPSFVMLTAISNLFGVGAPAPWPGPWAGGTRKAPGGSRRLPVRRDRLRPGVLSAVSGAGGAGAALCGATAATFDVAYGYALWVVILGDPAPY